MSSFTFEDMFGPTLVDPSGSERKTSDLDGKNVMLYFSAHWCGPCRGFTPKFADWYKNAKKNSLSLEVVFVSSDRDEEAFKDYHGEMPWLALPFSDRERKGKLSAQFKVQGIPTLVVVGPDGKLITKDGRSHVMTDEEGKNFPWRPKSLAELMEGPIVDQDGKEIPSSSLNGKPYAFYFSAHWCGPCQRFTPELAKTYKAVKTAGKEFEVVFVSKDNDEEAFNKYFAEMPWKAIPYADRDRAADLSKHFEVEGIPTLVIMGADGKVLNANGRTAVVADPEGANFPWPPKPVCDLEEGPDGINETPSLVVFCEKEDSSTKDAITAALAEIGQGYLDDAKAADKDPEFCFFTGREPEGLSQRVRKLCSLPEDGPTTMVLLDIPDSGGFYQSDAATIDSAVVRAFLKDYKNSSLERRQLAR